MPTPAHTNCTPQCLHQLIPMIHQLIPKVYNMPTPAYTNGIPIYIHQLIEMAYHHAYTSSYQWYTNIPTSAYASGKPIYRHQLIARYTTNPTIAQLVPNAPSLASTKGTPTHLHNTSTSQPIQEHMFISVNVTYSVVWPWHCSQCRQMDIHSMTRSVFSNLLAVKKNRTFGFKRKSND